MYKICANKMLGPANKMVARAAGVRILYFLCLTFNSITMTKTTVIIDEYDADQLRSVLKEYDSKITKNMINDFLLFCHDNKLQPDGDAFTHYLAD